MNAHTAAAHTEEILASRLTRIANATHYIAGFRTASGKELALERQRTTGVFLWAEPVAADAPAQLGARCEHYNAQAPRNSNLNGKNAPRLRVGQAACYWRLLPEQLPAFLDWYCTQ